jgi:RNA recognition motif-containing protein
MVTLQNPASLHSLQRTVGNRAVVNMIANAQANGSRAPVIQRKRLYVGNLSFGTSQDAVRDAFAAMGEVREVAMPTDRETGQPRGFAFVTMGNDESASRAIAELNGAMLDGRPLRVNEAQERPPRGGGGGFGGGGGGGRGGGGGGYGGGGGRGGRGGGRDRY